MEDFTVDRTIALKEDFYCRKCGAWIYCPEMNEKCENDQGEEIECIAEGCLKKDGKGDCFGWPECRAKNPFALQEMSAVMLETIRKGYWRPDQETIKNPAKLRAGLVKDFKPGCSVFVCDNAELSNTISGLLSPALSNAYNMECHAVKKIICFSGLRNMQSKRV